MSQQSDQFDFSAEREYNNSQTTEQPEKGKLIESIDLSKLSPIHDPNCQHEFMLDPSGDRIGDYVAVKCKHCPVGMFVRED